MEARGKVSTDLLSPHAPFAPFVLHSVSTVVNRLVTLMPLSWVCWNSCNSANPCARLFLFLGCIYATNFEICNGAVELEYSVTLDNYRTSNFAFFPIAAMYFTTKWRKNVLQP